MEAAEDYSEEFTKTLNATAKRVAECLVSCTYHNLHEFPKFDPENVDQKFQIYIAETIEVNKRKVSDCNKSTKKNINQKIEALTRAKVYCQICCDMERMAVKYLACEQGDDVGKKNMINSFLSKYMKKKYVYLVQKICTTYCCVTFKTCTTW